MNPEIKIATVEDLAKEPLFANELNLKIVKAIPVYHKTPKAPQKLHDSAKFNRLEDGVKCPVCGHQYGNAEGFNDPCIHLVAHFGAMGWEAAPATLPEGKEAFKSILQFAEIGYPVDLVTSGHNGEDEDWLVWQKTLANVA